MTLVGSKQSGSFEPSALVAHGARGEAINYPALQTESQQPASHRASRESSAFLYRARPIGRQTTGSEGRAEPKCVSAGR